MDSDHEKERRPAAVERLYRAGRELGSKNVIVAPWVASSKAPFARGFIFWRARRNQGVRQCLSNNGMEKCCNARRDSCVAVCCTRLQVQPSSQFRYSAARVEGKRPIDKEFLIIAVRNGDHPESKWDGLMFEVTEYTHPCIFVTCRRTGETYLFFVGADGIVTGDGPADEGRARRAAVAYLAERACAA